MCACSFWYAHLDYGDAHPNIESDMEMYIIQIYTFINL
jgi:hypothetical protein